VLPNRSAINAPAKSLKVVQVAPAQGRKPGLLTHTWTPKIVK
jgi:hypothetical protein